MADKTEQTSGHGRVHSRFAAAEYGLRPESASAVFFVRVSASFAHQNKGMRLGETRGCCADDQKERSKAGGKKPRSTC